MKTFALTLLTLAVVACQASAQSPGWAEKMLKDSTHDFGTVARGGKLVHRFPITNIYAVRMEITQLVSGCGCVTATASKRILEPRESTLLEVVMDTSRLDKAGAKTVGVRFTVGPEFVSSAEVKVTANVRPDIVFNPGQFNFGSVPRGQTPAMTLDVEYAGALAWQVTEVSTGRKDFPFTVVPKELYRQPGRVGYQLQLTLKPDAPAGVIKEDIFLKTNDPASPIVPVLVEANVQPALTVTPGTLTLGAVKPGEQLVRRVVVRGTRPFVVTGVDGTTNGFAVGVAGELKSAPSTVQTVTLMLKIDVPGDFRKTVDVKTDQGEAAQLIVEGTAVP